MRYRLRTLLIVVAIGPPLLAGAGYYAYQFMFWRSVCISGQDRPFVGKSRADLIRDYWFPPTEPNP